jgi:hypothetical protein
MTTLSSDFATATRQVSHFYADGTGGSDNNNGLSAATPKKTLQAVFDIVPDVIKHTVIIHLTGTFTMAGDDAN